MKDIVTPYIGELITAIIALVLGWFGKSKAQKRQDNADVLTRVQGIYDKMVEDTNQRMNVMQSEIDALKKKQTEIDTEWRKKIQAVERKWQTKYSRLQQKHSELLKEFEEYKTNHK